MEHETEHPTERRGAEPVVAAAVPDARVTLTEAARLTGASRNRLYRALEANRLTRSEDGLISLEELVAAGFELKEPLPSAAKPADHVSFLLAQYTDVAAQLRESLEDQNDDLRTRIRMLEEQVGFVREQLRLSQQREAQLMQLLQHGQVEPAASSQRTGDAAWGEPQAAAAEVPHVTHTGSFADDQAADAPLPVDTIPSGAHQRWPETEPETTQAGGFLRRWKS
jgi:hypothetical protein